MRDKVGLKRMLFAVRKVDSRITATDTYLAIISSTGFCVSIMEESLLLVNTSGETSRKI